MSTLQIYRGETVADRADSGQPGVGRVGFLFRFLDSAVTMHCMESETELSGTVQNGVIVIDTGVALPEGARVKVLLDNGTTLAQRLQKFKGCAQGLPDDLAQNHDHYLYGTPKK